MRRKSSGFRSEGQRANEPVFGKKAAPCRPPCSPHPSESSPARFLACRGPVRRLAVGRSIARLVRGGALTPRRFALSVGVGLFVGTLPLYGGHLLLCSVIALPLRLNLLVAYAAANISIPPLIPFLLYGSVQLGSLILEGHALSLAARELEAADLGNLGMAVVIGSPVLGLLLAVLGTTVAYIVARWVIGLTPAGDEAAGLEEASIEAAVVRTVHRYRDVPPWHRHYVSFKFRLDPLTGQLLDLVPQLRSRARALDLGCGRGQFLLLLAELGVVREGVGVDLDAEKVRVAVRAARSGQLSAELRFSTADLSEVLSAAERGEPDVALERGPSTSLEVNAPRGDSDRVNSFARAEPSLAQKEQATTHPLSAEYELVLLLDVLHYLPREEQRELLLRSARRLVPGGQILVRETNRRDSWGARWASAFERIARALGVNRGHTLEFQSPEWIGEALRQEGLIALSSENRGPLDNVLVVFEKPRRTEPSPLSSADAAQETVRSE